MAWKQITGKGLIDSVEVRRRTGALRKDLKGYKRLSSLCRRPSKHEAEHLKALAIFQDWRAKFEVTKIRSDTKNNSRIKDHHYEIVETIRKVLASDQSFVASAIVHEIADMLTETGLGHLDWEIVGSWSVKKEKSSAYTKSRRSLSQKAITSLRIFLNQQMGAHFKFSKDEVAVLKKALRKIRNWEARTGDPNSENIDPELSKSFSEPFIRSSKKTLLTLLTDHPESMKRFWICIARIKSMLAVEVGEHGDAIALSLPSLVKLFSIEQKADSIRKTTDRADVDAFRKKYEMLRKSEK